MQTFSLKEIKRGTLFAFKNNNKPNDQAIQVAFSNKKRSKILPHNLIARLAVNLLYIKIFYHLNSNIKYAYAPS